MIKALFSGVILATAATGCFPEPGEPTGKQAAGLEIMRTASGQHFVQYKGNRRNCVPGESCNRNAAQLKEEVDKRERLKAESEGDGDGGGGGGGGGGVSDG